MNIVLWISGIYSQNLVSNPGFEIYSSTEDTAMINNMIKQGGTIFFNISQSRLRYEIFGRYCIDWNGSTYALRNRCWDSLGLIIGKPLLTFENEFDTVNLTHTGMSSANLVFRPSPYLSSQIGAKLKDTLCKGCTYNISFNIYVTQKSNIILNNFGLIFNPDYELSEKDQSKYFVKSNQKLKRGEWQKIEYSYVAQGNEIYFSFGKYWKNHEIHSRKRYKHLFFMSLYFDDIIIEKSYTEQKLEPQN